MSEHLPTVRQIDRARPSLRQAEVLATQIEVLNDIVPDSKAAEIHRRQFLFQLEQAASALGMQIIPNKPVSLVIDNTNHAEAGPR